jgi:hypothetical protein
MDVLYFKVSSNKRQVKKKKNAEQESKSQLNLIKMLITMCILFIFGNLPLALYDLRSVFDLLEYRGDFFENFSYFCYTCLFSYHSSDLFVYLIFNKRFKNTLMENILRTKTRNYQASHSETYIKSAT